MRVYFWSSAPHVADPNQGAPVRGVCQNLSNVVQTSMLFRALLDAMDRWASDDVAPPASRIPRCHDGSLVGMDEWRTQFPAIPGVATPRGPNALPLFDFGPEAGGGIQSTLPPELVDSEGYAVLVPAVDADGNDVAGVRVPMVEAPLATYTGWNLRGRGQGEGAMHEFTGSTIPLPDTESTRAATGDPRPSIEQRYGDAVAYVAAIVDGGGTPGRRRLDAGRGHRSRRATRPKLEPAAARRPSLTRLSHHGHGPLGARHWTFTTAPLVADSCAASTVRTASIASSGVISAGRVPSRTQRAK